jgi:hypothetical protein
MGLSSLLEKVGKGTTSDDNGPWRQFILDHLDYIAARCQTYTIEPDAMNRYKYDIKRFLFDKLQVHEDIAWIVRYLNHLPNDFAFNTPGDFVIPTDSLIIKLKHSFVTIQSNPL